MPTEAIPSPREIMKTAAARKLDAVALTDHNTVKGWAEARREAKAQGILFIPGIEVSSREGHVLGIGVNETVPRGRSLEETVERIHDAGGIAIAPHPFDIKGDGVRDRFPGADAAEVFNSLNLDRFSNLVMRHKIGSFPAVAGSDAHTLAMIGNCVNVVDATTVDGALRAIRRGRVQVTTAYPQVAEVRDWAHQRFSASREAVERRIEREYPPFTRWLSLRMLDKFLQDRGGFFTALAHVGIACSYGYGAAKAFTAL